MATSTTSRSSSVNKRTTRKPVPPKKPRPAQAPLTVPPEAGKTRSKTARRTAPAPAIGKASEQTKVGRGKKNVVKKNVEKKNLVQAKPHEKAKSKPQRAQLALAIPAAGVGANLKAKRARVPKDFAEQYGEKTKKRRRAKTTDSTVAVSQTKRRDAAARERLRQLMMPTDDVVRRLAQAGAIASSLLMDDGVTSTTARRRSTATVRRPRRWETRCGKCGTNGQFKAAAGLCARCGAIVVRDGIGV